MRFVKPPLIRRREGTELRLGLRTLYILPTRFGLLWLATAGLLYLVGLQMRSNGSLLLSFLLLGLMLLSMHLTHDNLQGLSLKCGDPEPSFAGQAVLYPLLIQSRDPKQRLELQFRGADPLVLQRLSAGQTAVDLPWPASERGWQTPGRLHIETTAPLGLFVCWSSWEPSRQQLIYPARRVGPVVVEHQDLQSDGLEEWQDVKPHRPGERLALVDWTSLAKGRRLQSKQFADPSEESLMLSPAAGLNREQALEHLAHCIWQMHQRGAIYGLRLAGQTLHPCDGVSHRDACLELLATARR